MKNLLVFSFFPAYTPPSNGGEVRLHNFYTELSHHFNITLLSSAHVGGDEQSIWHNNNFLERRIPKDDEFVKQWQRLTHHSGAGDLSGPSIAASGKFLTELHRCYLTEYPKADAVIHDSPFTLHYDVFRGLDNKPRVYNSYNCEFALYKRLHLSSGSTEIANLVRSIEKEMLDCVDLVTYCGTEDIIEFKKLSENVSRKSLFMPNGMAIRNAPLRKKSVRAIKKAVFLGSGHLPNVEAADFLVHHIAPKCPGIVFHIIGDCLADGIYPANIVRHGRVSDLAKTEIICDADFAVNPMLSGGGSSLKILDFVSHGIPLVSTPIGIRGFDFKNGVDCLTADKDSFASILNKHIKGNADLLPLAKSAKKVALALYTWKTIAQDFKDALLKIAPTCDGGYFQNVLALNDYNPFSSVGGGATRLQGSYLAISRWSPVIMICFSSTGKLEAETISTNLFCIQVPKTSAHVEEESYYNTRSHISVNDIVALRHSLENPILQSVYEILRANARIVICDHPYMSPLVARSENRFIYSSQNYEFGLKKALLEWHPDKEVLLTQVGAAERFCIGSAASIIAVSENDAADLLRGARTSAPVVVIPNGSNEPQPSSIEDKLRVKKDIKVNSAVFLGSSHMPNVDAAKYIVEVLAVKCAEIDFHLVGSVCQSISTGLPKNVFAWGVVSESMKTALLQQCSVAINPMFSGSGSNVKLADFLSNGLFIVSTAFGIRGYGSAVEEHVSIADRDTFAEILKASLKRESTTNELQRQLRKALFTSNYSMTSLASRFVDVIKGLERKKRRMLFVTYRYTYPYQGGGEYYLSQLLSHIGKCGEYSIDVVAPEVTQISDRSRFASAYFFEEGSEVPPAMENLRFARFPIAMENNEATKDKLLNAWRVQSELEKALYKCNDHIHFESSGLAWGWGGADINGREVARWGYTDCGLYTCKPATITIKGFARCRLVMRILGHNGAELCHQTLEDAFEVIFTTEAGFITLQASLQSVITSDDPRWLAIYVKGIFFDAVELDLRLSPLSTRLDKDALTTYSDLYNASLKSRGRHNITLTDIRGPHSPSLESFLEHTIRSYDLVVTHNNVFRPSVAAIRIAKNNNIPSLLLPHAHLDDDFYHFPDVHQAALDADLVLACPQAACDFYEKIGAKNVKYHSPGIDPQEVFSELDEIDFRKIYPSQTPFFLVLGRKARAKGYEIVIAEIEKIALVRNVHLVIIGPDEDHIPIRSARVTYLGQQPRNVVRGALRSSIALVNMSSSESFGMVLLESWMAGRPVVVNRECSAFHDLATHNVNALIIDKDTLGGALLELSGDRLLADRLGRAGTQTTAGYEWSRVSAIFLQYCNDLIDSKKEKK